ncbi:hypothetical protein H5410_056324 [Solanum commersonii]|uniref:Uncharacterized protein n=1 Tax=Solanum commersonii TaxID=4109 RepID=A0A9J5WMS6_SOLCO|nr:hypothetical protein H5410_056324 [Solanum commersonii]
MTNFSSSSRPPISQEVENPSSFNFSIPLPEESPSTPVCGVGETVESTTHLTKVVVSPVLPSGEILPCSPTLVLSCDKSQNSKAQCVMKPNVKPLTKEVEMASRAVSSIMSKRLFEGDFPEERGPESNILAAGVELVVVQSLASLRGDVQPTLLDTELRSPKQVPHNVQPVFDQTPRLFDVESEKEKEEPPLKWSRTEVRGATTLTVGVPDRNIVKSSPEADLINESTEFAKERQRKGKGKIVEFHSKGDKKRYGTRSETQKVMGSAIAASIIQMESDRKRRREGHEPKKPTSTHLHVGSSYTESDDVAAYVVKRMKQ